MSCIAHLAVSEIFLQSSPSMFFCCGWRWTGLLHCSTPLLERCVYHTTARELIQLDPTCIYCSIQATSSYTEKLQISFPRLICHWENKSICTIHGASASTLTGQEHIWQAHKAGHCHDSAKHDWDSFVLTEQVLHDQAVICMVQHESYCFKFPNTLGQVYKHWYSIQNKV